MPIAQALPAGAASTVLMMNSVEPTKSAAVTTSCLHSGCTRTLTPGMRSRTSTTDSSAKRPCTEQWPFHRITFAARSCVGGEAALRLVRVVDHAVVEREAELEHGGVAAEVLVGQEEHLLALLERPLAARAARWTTCTRHRRCGR